jgi:hypothetical protein
MLFGNALLLRNLELLLLLLVARFDVVIKETLLLRNAVPCGLISVGKRLPCGDIHMNEAWSIATRVAFVAVVSFMLTMIWSIEVSKSHS